MFSWICEKCGRECLPSQRVCPYCTKPEKPADLKVESQPDTKPVEVPKPAATVKKSNANGWLVGLLAGLAIAAIGGGAFYGIRYVRNRPEPVVAPKAAAATPSSGRQLEVTGLRLTEDDKKNVQLTFALINHARQPMDNIRGRVVLKAKGEKIGEVQFSVAAIGANASVDVTMPLATPLHAYELPDWQFLSGELELAN